MNSFDKRIIQVLSALTMSVKRQMRRWKNCGLDNELWYVKVRQAEILLVTEEDNEEDAVTEAESEKESI